MGEGYTPRIVFASSIAVFGEPFPDMIGDDQCLTPLTSYGTQKAICELPSADYSRRGALTELVSAYPRSPFVPVRRTGQHQASSRALFASP